MTLKVTSILWAHSKTLILILTPLVWLPIPLVWQSEEHPQGGNMAFCLLLMATYWVTEVMPLPVTAMMPVFLFPLLGIDETDNTCKAYFNDVQFLVMGGLMIAIAVETWNVHERIALKVLTLVGAKLKWIMLGFMLVTAILSMFISNTATTAMMIPIANAILDEIRKSKDENTEIVRRESMLEAPGLEMKDMTRNGELDTAASRKNSVVPMKNIIEGNENPTFVDDEYPSDGISRIENRQNENRQNEKRISTISAPRPEVDTTVNGEQPPVDEKALQVDKMMLLSVCWSANLGGLGMLTGTSPNLVLKAHVDQYLGGKLTFLNWSAFCIPTVAVFLVIAWVWLQVWFLMIKGDGFRIPKRTKDDEIQEKRIEKLIRDKYSSLGPIRFPEITVLVLFGILVILWFSRDTGFAGGYGMAFDKNETHSIIVNNTIVEKTEMIVMLKDAVPAILIPMLLFILPSEMPRLDRRVDRLLDWKTTQAKMPWNVIMLLGGGFALARGMTQSGLSSWVGKGMTTVLKCVPVPVLSMIIAFVVTMTTEVASNTATTQIFTPIMSNLARQTGVNPFNTLIPTAVSASFAFMLPVATPPNAIAFSYGKISIMDMALPGIVMNIMGVFVIGLGMNSWGVPIFQLHNPNYPIPQLPNINNTCY